MKLSIRGWARDAGNHTLVEGRLQAQNISADSTVYWKQIKAVPVVVSTDELSGPRGFRIVSSADISANGNYLVTCFLGTDEILLLALEATKNWSTSQIVDRIIEVRSAQSQEAISDD